MTDTVDAKILDGKNPEANSIRPLYCLITLTTY